MGLLDFFRKKKEEPLEEVKEIKLSEADDLLLEKFEKEGGKIKEIKNEVDQRIESFIHDLVGKINILNLIDLKDRKEDEKVKSIVLASLGEYVEQLSRLVTDLKKIESKKEAVLHFKEIDSVINYFYKNSRKKFEKANYLVGRELNETEAIIKLFYREMNEIAKKSQKGGLIFEKKKELDSLKGSILNLERSIGEIDKQVLNLEKEYHQICQENIVREKELNSFKESSEFREWLRKKEETKNELGRVKSESDLVKEKIDLKSLLRDYHSIEKKRELIKRYRDNFLGTLEEDTNLEIIEMLDSDKKGVLGDEIKNLVENTLRLKEQIDFFKANEKVDILEKVLGENKQKLLDVERRGEEEKKKLEKFRLKSKSHGDERVKILEGILDGVRIIRGE